MVPPFPTTLAGNLCGLRQEGLFLFHVLNLARVPFTCFHVVLQFFNTAKKARVQHSFCPGDELRKQLPARLTIPDNPAGR